MSAQQIGFGVLLVAVILVTLALAWGPLVLLFKWKDAQRWWYLTAYMVALLIGLGASYTVPVGTEVRNPLFTILVVLIWVRVFRVWRVRRRTLAEAS